ncbi:uncharacterized protein si:ch73-103b9.2 [Lates calcarifer]|uniref:Uncharacterized protein si:ch73-103b9.2 n=1 Tax=Lates calcarifer TaxID=8187 RepID=A0AAJ7LHD4_LATCA|nr:uncharacterized protein si:ch73-103b9.2 [Lates calcarifer]XP_018523497.1 uncharacterized protein si:ch73-103b9.2 [Lates calcarifer]
MATSKEVDHTAVGESDKELPAQEDTVGERPHKAPERRHVDVLLDISEEDFLKELEPYEYHCYSGLEEAVRGWARVAPLSCILVTQKRFKKPKHKEADTPTPLSVEPALANADSSASTAEHRYESQADPQNIFKKSTALNQQVGSWSNTAVAVLQQDASAWQVLKAMQKTTSHTFSCDQKIEEEGMLREIPLQPLHLSSKYSVSDTRLTKPQKHSHRPNNTVVPIKNFTFLPPIKSPHLNPKASGQLCSGKKASEGETLEENCFMCDKRSETRGTRVDPVANTEPPNHSAALTSKYRTCHNPHLFSAVSVSIPKRYQVPMSSKPDTVHHRSYSMGKSLTQALHASTTTGPQAHMLPSCLFS